MRCGKALRAICWETEAECERAEDRVNQLEAELELLRDRAVRAERWLQTIQKEIEEKLIAPRPANATEQTSLPKTPSYDKC
jgi:DNA repair exonuclease SbcCD ATPase subunit